MAPLIVLVAAWTGFAAAGALGFGATAHWTDALRHGLAVMFAFAAASHFVPRTRAEQIAMVPPQLPRPALLVTLSGLLELAGAVGLLIPSLARFAALGLALMLVALFPANARAARTGLTVAGRRAMPLVPRLLLQLFWVAALVVVALHAQ